jgi:hypothetical protein
MNTLNTKRYWIKNFLKGFASAFDLSGQRFLEIPDLNTGFERDKTALAGDWRRIGNDMYKTMDQFRL